MANKRTLSIPTAAAVGTPVQRPRKNGQRLDLTEAMLDATAGAGVTPVSPPTPRDPAASQSPFIPLAPPVDVPANQATPALVLERLADNYGNLLNVLNVWVHTHPYSTEEQLSAYLKTVIATPDWQQWLGQNFQSVHRIISDQRASLANKIRKLFKLLVRSEADRMQLRLWELRVWPQLLAKVGVRGVDGEAFVAVTCQLYARGLNYHDCDPRMVLARMASIAGMTTAIVAPPSLTPEEYAKAIGDDPAALRTCASTPPRSRNRGRAVHDIDELLYQAAASVTRPPSQASPN